MSMVLSKFRIVSARSLFSVISKNKVIQKIVITRQNTLRDSFVPSVLVLALPGGYGEE